MNRFSRRGLATAAAIVPAALMAPRAHAQSATESALDRVQRTKTLRIAALPGAAPYFVRDLASGTWKGACVEMAADIARVFDAQVDYVDTAPTRRPCWTCNPTRWTWRSR